MMDDLISRQAAIQELDHGVWGKEYDKALAKAMLESLPTIQPEKRTEKHTETHSCDLISRQEAINALAMADARRVWRSLRFSEIQKVLLGLPSAQPKKGKWSGADYDGDIGLYVCDQCRKFAMMKSNFCPNCGARMVDEDE